MDFYSTLMYSTGRFEAYSSSHVSVLALSLGLAVALVVLGRTVFSPAANRQVQVVLGITIIALETVFVLYPLPLGKFHVRYSLPLQLCDVTAYMAGLALIFRWPLATEVAFYLGCTTTLVTTPSPDLGMDFPHIEFICFFASHSLVSAAMVFTVFGVQEPIRTGAALRVWVLVHALGVPIGLVNVYLGSNYFYICHKPGVATMFDLLGPWPYYVIAIDILLILCLLLLDVVLRRLQGQVGSSPKDARVSVHATSGALLLESPPQQSDSCKEAN